MTETPDPRPEALDALLALHRDVDAETGSLAALHAGRLNCRSGCADCCVDGLTVFEVEAERIRRAAGALLLGGQPHAPGGCAFLDAQGACRIYEHRPYVCRTQGLPLRWLEERPDGSLLELRDICPLNDEGPPLEHLPPRALWTLGPWEERLAEIEVRFSGGERRRRPLRELFGGGAAPG